MYTLLKPIAAREILIKNNVAIFTSDEFSRLFNLGYYRSKYFLEEQTKGGLFIRLKKGLYALKTDLPSEVEIANKLYRPSYISFEYVLAYYNIIPEMPYRITSATTKPTRLFGAVDRSFAYYTIKKEAYTGYVLAKRDGKSFLIAEPEKALVDYVYFESLGKKSHNERLEFRSLDKEKIYKYARLFKKNKLINLLKNAYAIGR